MKIIIQYSGGKDSHASLLYVKNNYPKKWNNGDVIVIFCDTGWEAEKTYKHINYVQKHLGIKIKVLKSKKYKGMIDMAEKKKRFPSTKARFCTEELKIKPFIDFLLNLNEDVMIIQGIRKDESFKRSKMAEHCHIFKYYFYPYKLTSPYDDEIADCKKQIAVQKANNTIDMFAPGSNKLTDIEKQLQELTTLHEKAKKPHYHTYRKKEVIAFTKKHAEDIYRPIFHWSANDVFDYIKENGMYPNPLYLEGFSRVGCFPCIMCRHAEFRQILKRYPERMKYILEQEKRIESSFFKIDYIPNKYCTKKTVDKEGNIKMVARVDDIIKYLNENSSTMDAFEEIHKETSCQSIYGLCET